MSVKVIVATHKKYDMPKNNIYLPLHVGGYNKEDIGYIKDDSNDNISNRNASFCELTGLYWAWKNVSADYIGLVHYRRHFKGKKRSKNKLDMVLTNDEVNNLLKNTDIILPKMRNYFIETLYEHYSHTLYIEPLDRTREIIKNKYPKYLEEFDKLKIRKKAHMFNMFIMKKDILNDYCNFLFDILFELEKQCSDLNYDSFHSRYFGRISELLLDVYINTNKLKYSEVKVINIEKINYINKIFSFLKAKFKGVKYEKSF